MGSLLGLSLRICYSPAEDLSLIFADPVLQDVQTMVSEKYILEIVQQLVNGRRSKDCVDKVVTAEVIKDETIFPEPSVHPPTPPALSPHLSHSCSSPGSPTVQMDDPGGSSDIETEEKDLNYDQLEEDVDDIKDEDYKESPPALSQTELPFQELDNKKLQCLLCNKTVSSRSNAKKHMQVHGLDQEPIEERTCPHCNKVFDYANLCKKHLKRTCKMMMKAKCDTCELVFESGVLLKQHIKLEHDACKFKCRYCDHIASSAQNKLNHEKRIHLNLDCKLCRKLFDSEQEKDLHVCEQTQERYKCDKCEKSYKAKGELRNHMLVVHEGLRYPCPHCQDVLSSVQALRRHERSFHMKGAREHVCDICSEAFTHKETLKKHILTHDSVMRSDPCPFCGKVLRSKDVLRQHIKTLHEKKFSIVCEDCGQKFANKHRLEIHKEMVHLKGKVLVCQTCGKECLGKRRLHNHITSKHPKGQKFVPCQYCGQEIGEKQLRSHIVEAHKAHNYKFQCEHCHKRFPVKGHIKRHIRVHTGARPYLCRGCGSFFVDLEAVKDHIRRHHNGDVSLAHYDIAKDIDNPYA